MLKSQQLAKILSTGFGSGLSPKAPGTTGSIAIAFILFYLIGENNTIPISYLLGISAVTYVIGIWSIKEIQHIWGKDPGKVVIDEWLGMLIALSYVNISLTTILLAFGFFRLFDIWKPWGVRQMDARGDAHGVMMDDVVAGIYANICVHICIYAM